MFAVIATAACVTPTSLSPVTCDASALRGVLARVPLPQHGLELVVADSRIPGAGRGLFACTTTTDAQLLPSGTPLCGLAAGTWHAQASGDSAVPFEFTDAGQLVLHDGELAPLERPLRERADSGLYAHRVLRFGPPGQQSLMVSNAPGPDLPAPKRMFIPTPPEGELPPEAWRQQAGQYANDLAFEPGLLAQKDAYWVYEQASAESNLLALFWTVRLEEGKGAEDEAQWVPGEVQLVTQRDTRLPAQAGVAHELGVMYGIEYWRRRDMGR